jgi:hypothetical protein
LGEELIDCFAHDGAKRNTEGCCPLRFGLGFIG